MTRFFVTPEEMTGDSIVLTGENAAHAKVLRLKEGEQVLDPSQDSEWQERMAEAQEWADENLASGDWTQEQYDKYMAEQKADADQNYEMRVSFGGAEKYYLPDSNIQRIAAELSPHFTVSIEK